MKQAIALVLVAATSAAAQVPAPSAPATQTVEPQPGFSRPAAARQRPCLTSVEAKGLATFILPGLVEGLAQRCRGTLGRDAYLRTAATQTLSERLRRDADPSWPVAKAAIEKLNGGDRLPGFFGEQFIKTMAESTAADLTLREFDKSDCSAANDLVAGLAPLPSSNFSSVIAAIIALGADAADAKSPLRICPAAPPPR